VNVVWYQFIYIWCVYRAVDESIRLHNACVVYSCREVIYTYCIVSIDDCNRGRSYIKYPFVCKLYKYIYIYTNLIYTILRVVYYDIKQHGRDDKKRGRNVEREWDRMRKKEYVSYYYTRGGRYCSGARACAVGRYPFTVGRFMMDSVCWSTGQLHSRRAGVAARSAERRRRRRCGSRERSAAAAVLSSPILKIGEAMFTRKRGIDY